MNSVVTEVMRVSFLMKVVLLFSPLNVSLTRQDSISCLKLSLMVCPSTAKRLVILRYNVVNCLFSAIKSVALVLMV